MAVNVRRMEEGDARLFLETHRASVRGLAARDYPPAVVDAWAPMPVTDAAVEAFVKNPGKEIRFVAELLGEIVGIGALVLENSELRACYVKPHFARRGVGSALVAEIERAARLHGLTYLRLESSVTAEPFYTARGYAVEERGEHVLTGGVRMAAIRMLKNLRLDS